MDTDWEMAYLPGGVMTDGAAAIVPPKVTGVKVAAGADQNLALLIWNAPSGDAGITGYEVLLANGKTVKTKTNSVSLKKLDAGSQTVTVVAVDKAKNRSAGTKFTFKVADITAPKTGKVTAVQTAADKVRLDLTGFSDNVGVKKYRIYLDGKLVGTTATTSFTYRKANLAGKLAFTVTAVDAAGNESKPGKVNVTIQDVTAPDKVTGIKVAPGANQNLAVLNWQPAADNVGVTAYEVQVEGGKRFTTKTNSITLKKLAGGATTVTVYALDKAKNRSIGANYTFNVADGTAPKNGKVAAVQTSADTVKLTMTGFFDNIGIKNYRIYLDGKLVGTTATTSFTYRKANLAGKLAFTVTAVDAAGNESKPGKVNVTIQDVTAPDKVTGIKVAPGANQNLAVLNWQPAADNVGVTAYEVQVEGGKRFTTKTNSITLKKLAGGATTVTVYALDKAKNRSAGTKFTFKVADGTAPKTGKVTAVQTAADKVRLDMTGFSDDVGINKYRIYLDGKLVGTTATTSFTYRKANLAGKLAFTVTAVDAAGNESKPGKVNVTIQDVTAPDKVTGVKAELSGQTAVIRWNPAADNVGVVSYDVVIDGKHYSAKTNSYVLKKVVDGATYKVTVAAVDKARNVGLPSDVVTFGKAAPPKDTTPPGKVTGVKAVLSGADATISWKAATDNVGVVGYEVTVNGRKYNSVTPSLVLKKLAAGSYKVTVRALDKAGNAGALSDAYDFRYSPDTPVTSATNVRLHSNGVVVESAASMSGKTVSSGWLLVAEKGGTVAHTVVNGGTLLVSNGAAATDTVINSGQGSAANASFSKVTMKRGYLTLLDGGRASDVTLSGGALIVRTSGSALNNRILAGSVDVSSGGVVHSTTVASGVYLRTGAGGSALAVYLGSGAHAVVSSGGMMSGGTVSGGAGLTVSKGGIVRNMQVLAGGSAYVSNGATVSDLKLVGNYVKMQLGIDSATNVHFISSGVAHTVSKGALSDVTAHLYTYLEVSAGGLVKNIRLGDATTSKGGAVEVFSGGRAETIANHNYGQVNVFGGGFLSGASTDTEGEIYLYGGSAANLRADRKGYIWIHSGSVANQVKVTSAGELTVSSGGSAAGVTVMSKGHAMVEERNGFVTDVDIQSTGILEVCGGNASGVTVRNGGLLTFSSGFVIMDGPWKQSLNGQASNVVLSGGTLVARYTGSATQVAALAGAEIQVSSASTVKNLTLSSGASAVVDSAGTLNGADILSGALLNLRPGATAAAVRVSSGAVVNLNFSTGMTVNGEAGRREFTGLGGLLMNYTQALGVLSLKAGTTGSALEVVSGGRVNLESGTSANQLTVGIGAVAYLYGWTWDVQSFAETHLMAGGQMTSASIAAGYTQLHADGSASSVQVGGNGRLLISGGASVDGLQVTSGGVVALYDGGRVASAEVAAGGSFTISNGASVAGLTVSSGGKCYVSGSAEDVRTYTDLHVFHGGVVSALTAEAGFLHISGGASGDNVRIESSARVMVYDGGRVSNLGIQVGGNAVASAGAVIDGLQTNGSAYVLTLKPGAVLTGNIELNEGRVMAEEGSVVKWDLTQSAPSDIALIRGLEFINGGSFTIAVSSTQQSGSYLLGSYTGSGKTFDRDVTVTVDGVSIGAVNPASPGGGNISSGELNLELLQCEGIVSLEVSHVGSLSAPCSAAGTLRWQDNAVDLGAFAAPELDLLNANRRESAAGMLLASFGG